MKQTYKIIIFLVVIAVLIFLLAQGKQEKAPISIGAVIPQTGFGSYWGKPDLNGIRLAELDLRAKYGEDRVRVIVEDGQSAIPASVSAAQKLLNVDKVDAVYAEFSGPSSAISPIVKGAGKAFVYSTFNQKITIDNEYSIKTFISFETGCEKLATYVNDPSKKFLIISSIGDAAPYCERALLRYFPRENVRMIDAFVGTDFRTVLLQNKSFDPDFIIPIMYEDGSFALIKQKNELGLKATIYSYRQDSVTEKVLTELPTSYTDGMAFFEVPIDPLFMTRIKRAYPEMTDDDIQAAANGYQSIMLLGHALAHCPDRGAACVTTQMANSQSLENPGYRNASVIDRVLRSELLIGTVKKGRAVLE